MFFNLFCFSGNIPLPPKPTSSGTDSQHKSIEEWIHHVWRKNCLMRTLVYFKDIFNNSLNGMANLYSGVDKLFHRYTLCSDISAYSMVGLIITCMQDLLGAFISVNDLRCGLDLIQRLLKLLRFWVIFFAPKCWTHALTNTCKRVLQYGYTPSKLGINISIYSKIQTRTHLQPRTSFVRLYTRPRSDGIQSAVCFYTPQNGG